ncbi:hypothetical protein M0R45_013512 [Rubus argutus]|uniref:Uncharacterized protein n=1 Tax=Rubus argutus TaxID=59490 RepID=A0AAW1XJN2_RUBAR
MAKTTPSPAILFLTFLLLITPPTLPTPPHTPQYRNLFSLAHSLMTRVANLRAARGDYSGSERARNIAAKMDRGLGLGSGGYVVGGMGLRQELLVDGTCPTRKCTAPVSTSLLRRLLRVFSGRETLREVVKAIPREVWWRDLGLQYASNSKHQDL